MYELTNSQRKYFGLNPIEKHWDKVVLKSDKYRTESILYFDKNTIKKHISSSEIQYFEKQYDELTRDRVILLPKTGKGKEKKLTASVLEQRQPTGVYLSVSCGILTIGNYNTQTTFYSSRWDNEEQFRIPIPEIIEDFICKSTEKHLLEINDFANSKRKNVAFKSGDYFCFKLNRTEYGFGRLLLDVNKIRKKRLINSYHGLGLLMGPPVIVELFVYKSPVKTIDIRILEGQPKLPSDVMMDNLLLYGEYEIIGHEEIKDEEFSFPISYGSSIDRRPIVFLQWGLIHKELPQDAFKKYIYTEETQTGNNPYGYYSIGFRPSYDSIEVLKTISRDGEYNFDTARHYRAKWDLRNPKNSSIKDAIFNAFDLDPNKTYFENSLLTNTPLPSEINNHLK
ncbi:MAG: immunity 26/phosphotriesterase HocA family protein [Bacteroidetes bacterium]|nr:immunity 26/phosphotriesterase HocA family protein [Bacteroidota bacterium]